MSEFARDELKVINDAREGIAAFEAETDGYCACDSTQACYLHGMMIPLAVEAAERIAQGLRRKALPPRRKV